MDALLKNSDACTNEEMIIIITISCLGVSACVCCCAACGFFKSRAQERRNVEQDIPLQTTQSNRNSYLSTHTQGSSLTQPQWPDTTDLDTNEENDTESDTPQPSAEIHTSNVEITTRTRNSV